MRKPRILLLPDIRNWAFDIVAKAMSNELAHSFDFEIKYASENPVINKHKFDLIYVYFWGNTQYRKYVNDSRKIIKEVSSHRWENEEKFNYLTPGQMAEKYLNDAGHVVTTSKRLYDLIKPHKEIFLCPNGFNPGIFFNKRLRGGKIKIGWAGRESDPCKGLHDIIKPACGDDFELIIAGGKLNQNEVAEFYGKIDVLCIASTAEGQPLPLFESMACGCFPICTDVGIVPELIKNGKNGLIVERSIEAFRNAFYWCQNNLDEVRKQGNINAEQMKEVRTWKKVAPIFEQMLWHVLEENKQNESNKIPESFRELISYRKILLANHSRNIINKIKRYFQF